MNRIARRYLQSLSPGVLGVLMLLVAAWALGLAGELTGWFSWSNWLGLDVAAVRHGQVWRLATYCLVVGGVLNLICTGLFILMCGPPVERAWSRREFWFFCLIAAAGTGVVGLWAQAWGVTVLGFGGVLYALLAAWARLEGNQRTEFPGLGALSVRAIAGVIGLVMFLSSAASAGVASALVTASGAGVGWLYLSVRWRWIESRQARTIACGRAGRLEL